VWGLHIPTALKELRFQDASPGGALLREHILAAMGA
jgi:hypothetical protein